MFRIQCKTFVGLYAMRISPHNSGRQDLFHSRANADQILIANNEFTSERRRRVKRIE
jgi:hypothetical protein